MELHGMDKDAKQKRINGDNIIEEWIQDKLGHPGTGGMPEAAHCGLADLMVYLITYIMREPLHTKIRLLEEIHNKDTIEFVKIMNDPTADKERAAMLAEKSELLAEIARKLQEHERTNVERTKDNEALEWFRKMEDKKKERESGMRLLTERFTDRYIPKTPQPPDDGVLGWDHADNVDDTDDIIVGKFSINGGGSNSKTRTTIRRRTRKTRTRKTRTRKTRTIKTRTIKTRKTRTRKTRTRKTRTIKTRSTRTRKSNKHGMSRRH